MEWFDNRIRGQARLAQELMRRGWQVFGYTQGNTESDDMLNMAHWHGYATHPAFPGYTVVCGVSTTNATEYLQPNWPKIAPNGAGSTFYTIWDMSPDLIGPAHPHGACITSGIGASWAGSLGDGIKQAASAADGIHGRVEREHTRKRKRAEKARRRAAIEERKQARAANKTAREAAKEAAANAPTGASAPGAKQQKGRTPAPDLSAAIVLPPVSPFIADRTPVVVDAIVANLMQAPQWLPDADFAGLAAQKIAEHYGFDPARTLAAARQVEKLLHSDDVAGQEPKARSTLLRSAARQLLN
jgi:hypothetical protein